MSGIRLNLGPGAHYAADWINIDKFDLPHHDRSPDLIHDFLEGLPFDDASVEQVYAGHVCEHVPYDLLPGLIAECWRVLAPGGRLAVVGPCLELAIRTNQPSWLLNDIIANPTPETPGLGHEWTPTAFFTLRAVRKAIPGAQLVPVETIAPPTWPNSSLAPWQCAVLASRPGVDPR